MAGGWGLCRSRPTLPSGWLALWLQVCGPVHRPGHSGHLQLGPWAGSGKGARYAFSLCGLPSGALRRGCCLDSVAVAVAKLTPHHEPSCKESQTCLNYNLLVGP